MKTFNDLIRYHFATYWNSRTPVQYENVLFTPPNGGPWVRFNVVPGIANQTSLGPTSIDREFGFVQATVFVPLAHGTDMRDYIIDLLKPIFRKRRVGGALFGVPSVIVDTFVNATDPWYMASVKWNYILDEETSAFLS